jgi:hypothetical protein
MDYKLIISLVAIVLTIIGYVPYIRDIFKRKTVPHVFTFFIWGFASILTFALQMHGGGGVGAWVTLAAAIICLFIFVLGLKYGEKNITRADIIFFVISIISLVLWPIAKQPVWAVVLIVAVDVFGFLPTIRKSWNKPYSETLFTYQLCVFRHGMSMFGLRQFNLLTLLYPLAWTAANFIFVIILMARRKIIPKPTVN